MSKTDTVSWIYEHKKPLLLASESSIRPRESVFNPVKFWLFPAFDSAKLAEGQKKNTLM